jgi:hypothetical protein
MHSPVTPHFPIVATGLVFVHSAYMLAVARMTTPIAPWLPIVGAVLLTAVLSILLWRIVLVVLARGCLRRSSGRFSVVLRNRWVKA